MSLLQLGTSTGGLISFGLLAGNKNENGTNVPMTIDEVIDLYREAMPKIFEKTFGDRIYLGGFIDAVIDLYREAIPKIFEKTFWDRIFPGGVISLLILDFSLVLLDFILISLSSKETKNVPMNLHITRIFNFICDFSIHKIKALSIPKLKAKIAYFWLCLTNFAVIWVIWAGFCLCFGGYDPFYKLYYNLPYPLTGI